MQTTTIMIRAALALLLCLACASALVQGSPPGIATATATAAAATAPTRPATVQTAPEPLVCALAVQATEGNPGARL